MLQGEDQEEAGKASWRRCWELAIKAGVAHGVGGTAWAEAQEHERPEISGSLGRAHPVTQFDCFCFGSECCQAPHRALQRPLPTLLSTHLLQRPCDRWELLPDRGREHFWHMHAFPLKVTRSPGGNGSLKREHVTRQHCLLLFSGGRGAPPRASCHLPLESHGQEPQARTQGLSLQALPCPRCVTSGWSLASEPQSPGPCQQAE